MNLTVINLFFTLLIGGEPITFASKESRTSDNKVVYNEVKWLQSQGKDTWLMKQSHQGLDHPKGEWDELKIVVENKNVSFFQMKGNKQIPFKVSCFNCHSNGPRAIRPMDAERLSLSQKTQIFFMNMRIKTYGRLIAKNTIVGDVPFKHEGKITNETLKLAACIKCHNEDGFLSRGPLTRQQGESISFMVKNDLMPPLGSLTAADRKYLKDFVDGF